MEKQSRSHELRNATLALTEGLFAHMVDFGLWTIIYMAQLSVPQSQHGQLFRAQLAADRFLSEVNYDVLKSAIQNARKRGWITTHRHALPEITREGKKRLSSIIPRYDEKRVWDRRMHLVTYDIPETKKEDREKLRIHLRRLGCGLLQDSVWITPYNPIDTLRKFINEHDLGGTIIVSDMGKDGSIGEENLQDMIIRIYRLEELNVRYESWLHEVKEAKCIDSGFLILYLSILRNDPQLPFSLLPRWWRGSEAYTRVQAFLEKLL
ncbi:hypothetical protein A3A63_03445 [Candidatus Gottesmanbacteria bacterium RIFCSPLOWO2_01_FULL_46_9]|uniref:Transcriptional repressor PaaX-like central Cas2-like domain-containing protein n=1 Tax=Candidatus Gottesmanbacteria bacterium RIFCSPLOWO2_01_FULL_46_9 TaxID=1798394 RepID=A0A1F6B3E4_9BACT|nr:MAG: hypothetical protein A3A63_03445 [Candidatus Gottesmanbacteria bacterium RIFCSPLOWO2_01_FULL_46_9]